MYVNCQLSCNTAYCYKRLLAQLAELIVHLVKNCPTVYVRP